MSIETFFNYRNYRWLWLNLAALVIFIVLYCLDNPVGGRNGGTVLGYVFGGLAFAGILYLMWYGIRKRSYAAAKTTLKGCLAAHVWLGIMLTVLVPLHSGFSFSFNVHTLAYVLMVIVIVSGIYGAINYAALAPDIQSHRGGGTLKKIMEQLFLVSNEIIKLSKNASDAMLSLLHKIDFTYTPSLWRIFSGQAAAPIDQREAAELLVSLPPGEQDLGLKLIGLVNKKKELARHASAEVRVMTKLKLWLYIHLPVSCALLVCVLVHILAVFFYW